MTIIGLELEDLGLVAVGSHGQEFVRDGQQLVTSTYLEYAAVSVELKGAVLPGTEPLDPDGRPVGSCSTSAPAAAARRWNASMHQGAVHSHSSCELPLASSAGKRCSWSASVSPTPAPVGVARPKGSAYSESLSRL